ncbi:MAG TPA: APC family permease [Wenzhouxiangella sp.]|nr:APC family permease [Wenzhouxiangella sp.]
MTEAVKLRRGVGLASVVMLGAGTAIGVSIFSVLQPAAEVAGSGLLVAIPLAAVPMVFFACTYAWMASAVPVTGASYEWPRRFIHPAAGFIVAWLRILTNVGAITVLGTVLVNYVGMAVPLPVKPVMAVLFTVIFALNFFGVAIAARLQTVLMILLAAMIAIFSGAGITSGQMTAIGPMLTHGWAGTLAAVPLLITLFLGIETAVEIGDEVRDARRNIPLGIVLGIALTMLIYMTVAAIALALVGPDTLAASDAPLLEAARAAMGGWATPVILGAASVSILTTINALVIIFSRSLYAMGKSRALPAVLEQVHTRFRTPQVALLVAYVLVMSGLLLPSNITFLLLAVNIPTMLKYLFSSISAIFVVRNYPGISARAALSIPVKLVLAVAWTSVVMAAGVLVLGLQAAWQPYVLVLGWALAGALVWVAYSSHHALEFNP